MGRLDKYLDEPAATPATGGRLAKYLDAEPVAAPPVPRGDTGLAVGDQGPPQIQDDPRLKSFPKMQELIESGRTVRDVDPKTGMISLAPLPGNEVKASFTDKPGQKLTADELRNIKTSDPTKPFKAMAAGALDTATLGYGDEIAAGISALGGADYQKERNLNRRLLKEPQAEDPTMALAGGLAGGLTLTPLSIGGGAARAVAEGAAIGGAAGLGSSEADLVGKDKQIGQAAWDATKGAFIGGVGTGAVIGGQKAANFIRNAPERVAERADLNVLDNLAHRYPKGRRDEMFGPLSENRADVLELIKTDPEFLAGLQNSPTLPVAKLAAQRAATREGELAAFQGDLATKLGPVPAERAIQSIEADAAKLQGLMRPDANKTAKVLADQAAKIREEVLPVEGRALISKTIAKAGKDEKARVLARRDDALKELEGLGIGKTIDDAEEVARRINTERQAVGAQVGELRKQAGTIPMRQFAATMTKAAQDLQKVTPVAAKLNFEEAQQALVDGMWRRYAPEHVNAKGQVFTNKNAAPAVISFDDARTELTAMQNAANKGALIDPSPAEKAGRILAGDVKTFLEEVAANNLPAEAAKRYRELNRRYSVLSDLKDAISPASLEAQAAPMAATVRPRTGNIDLQDLIASRNQAVDEGVQKSLANLVEAHIGKDASGKMSSLEKRAKLSKMMADALDNQTRDAGVISNPGLRGVATESTGTLGKATGSGAILGGLATANPAVLAAGVGLRLGVSGLPAKAAESLDRGIAAMVTAARKGASGKVLGKVGQMAGMTADLANEVALTIAQRIAPLSMGKVE